MNREAPPGLAHSLEDIHGTVAIPPTWWRRFLAFAGPALLVSVGYMDPGNWGSDIAAGSSYGYRLLWVLVMSNLMALLLQSLATRLGVVTGRDLAQACRDSYPRRTVLGLWVLCEIAIAATDLAEVIGTIIALKLLFNLPYLWGLAVAAGDTFLLLALQRRGIRLLELITLLLVAVIGGSFVFEIVLARPDVGEVARGFLPTLAPGKELWGSLYVAISMLGATVMPHNLYLHSALVQTRAFPQTPEGKRLACRYNFFDSLLALNGAFFVNAAILVLSGATFFYRLGRPVETLQDAYKLLQPSWGTALASVLFAVALLASGQSSTLTGTLAGQVVMEGFLHLRLRPWVRRLVTRCLALLPALAVIALVGHEPAAPSAADAAGTGPAGAEAAAPAPPDTPTAEGERGRTVDRDLLDLLVLTQVVLSLQLPFAVVPLVQFTSDPRRMGAFASRRWLQGLAWACAAVIVGLNGVLVYLSMQEWAEAAAQAGWHPLWVYGSVGPTAAAVVAFLGWVTVYPIWARREKMDRPAVLPALPAVSYRRIGVAVEFTPGDEAVLAQAAALARSHGAALVAVHVVEGMGAAFHGPASDDQESRDDRERITRLVDHLRRDGLQAEGVLGYGSPPQELVRLSRERELDLLVVGTHGHRFLADLALGETVSPVLHRLSIPVLVVPTRPG
jgi:manganese transport protein